MEHRRISMIVAALLLGFGPWNAAFAQSFADTSPGTQATASDGAPMSGADPMAGPAGWGSVLPAYHQEDLVDAHGSRVVLPASYYAGCSDQCMDDPGYGYGGDCGCGQGACGGGPMEYGYGTCPPFDDGMATAGAMAGYGASQCGPHYFDFRVEGVYIKRDQTFDGDVIFTTLRDDPPPTIALRSNQLDYDYEGGFRILGRYDIGPLSVVEFGYWGVLEFDTSATVVDPTPGASGDLFSLFSRPDDAGPTDFLTYGTTPPTVQVAGGPMPETERSFRQTIAMESELHNAEISYRRYWVGATPWFSGTLLAGARYTRLSEDLIFETFGEEEGKYLDHTENDLVGLQTGGDAWLHVINGIRVGAEGKAGIYNNRWEVKNTITSSAGEGPYNFVERFDGNQVAFIGEASADIVLDIFPSLSLRAGYEALWITPVVLAGPNFNTVSPYGEDGQATRVPFFMDESDVFYHGAHAGIEYIW